MGNLVLTVHAEGDAAAEPMILREVGVLEPLATYDVGLDTSPLVIGGVEVDPTESLSAAGLMQEARCQAIGKELWRRLTPGPIGEVLNQQLFTSRLHLDLRSPTLLRYPWELVRAFDFSLSTEIEFCLGDPKASASPAMGAPPPQDHPLRVLVVVGAGADGAAILADEELLAIEAAAHSRNDEILMRVLIQAPPSQVAEAIRVFRPHVLHFIGHGILSMKGQPPSILMYSADTDVNEVWDPERIRSVFRSSPPRLVVLNACQTAAPAASSSLATAFLEAGSLAVIAMLGEIRGDAARAFSEPFYRELFGRQTVAQSLTTARKELKTIASGAADGLDDQALRSNWPLPRLLVRSDVDSVIAIDGQPNDTCLRIDDFVVRWDERWRIWRTLCDQTSTSRLTVVNGISQIGKSEIIKTIADIGDRHGDRALMVHLNSTRTGDGLTHFLNEIIRAAEDDHLEVAELTSIVEGRDSSQVKIQRFQEALERCVRPAGLLLFLDGLATWEQGLVCDVLLPEFCEPYLRGTAPARTHVVMTLRTDWTKQGFEVLPIGWEVITVDIFPPPEWQRAMTHVRRYWMSRITRPESREQFATIAEAIQRGGTPIGETLRILRATAGTKVSVP